MKVMLMEWNEMEWNGMKYIYMNYVIYMIYWTYEMFMYD